MTGETKTVYVVVDDAPVRESLCRLLRAVGLVVETFASAVDFLNAAPPAQGACLVLDLQMPGMSGLELLECVAFRERALPVVVITGDADQETELRALDAGALVVLQKPLELQTLLEAVQRALGPDGERR